MHIEANTELTLGATYLKVFEQNRSHKIEYWLGELQRELLSLPSETILDHLPHSRLTLSTSADR